MTLQQQTTIRHRHEHTDAPQGTPESGSGPSVLLRQAAGFKKVAHEAKENCDRGADAERQLEQRKNRSAQ